MPALEALVNRLEAAHTLPCGISVDTTYSHAAWAAALGGVSYPLLADFHPKGEVASRFGVYLHDKGICDRATVIVDAGGTVRHASSVTPAGKRDVESLVALCEQLDAAWEGDLPGRAEPPGLPDDAVLYVRNKCMFSRWTLYARTNLHLEEKLAVRNVSEDEAAARDLDEIGGKRQAPALVAGNQALYESNDILKYLVERTLPPLV